MAFVEWMNLKRLCNEVKRDESLILLAFKDERILLDLLGCFARQIGRAHV